MLAQPNHFGPRYFHTSTIPEAARFAAWNHVVNDWLIGAEIRPIKEGPFQGMACLRALPDLRFGAGAFDGFVSRRSRAIVSQENGDLFLIVNAGGACSVSRRGRETDVPVGGAYLLSCADTLELRWPGPMKLLALRTREEAVSPLVRNLYDNLGRALPPDNENLRLLVRYLNMLQDADPLDEADTRALVTRHLQDLLALTLGALGGMRDLAMSRSVHAVRFEAAKKYIEKNLERFDLSPRLVALNMRISPRTVQRLFETAGTTFTEFVLERRLACTYAVLGRQQSDRSSIGDIAFAAGFNNISHFNHQFRARYGASPSDVRNSRTLL